MKDFYLEQIILVCSFLFVVSYSILGQTQLDLREITYNPIYQTKSVPGFRFLNDGRHYSQLNQNTIEKVDIVTGEVVENLFSSMPGSIQDLSIDDYSFSKDEQLILLATNKEMIYRRSSKNDFWIYNRTTQNLTEIYPDSKQMYATISPDNQKVAFVVNNDIWIKYLESGDLRRVTNDGKINHIINGAADWVYEEEFSLTKAFEWSPNSQYLAFMRFDESQVPEFTLTNYKNGLYPEYVAFKYPKVGSKNSTVEVHIYNLQRRKSKKVNLGKNEDIYIPRIQWTMDPEILCVSRMNRHQNHLELLSVKAKNGKSSVMYDEKNPYYIDVHDDLTFLDNGEEFIWTSEKDGYNHIYLVSTKKGRAKQLTSGEFDVTKVYGFNKENNEVIYQVASRSALQREIYRMNIRSAQQSIIAAKSGTNDAQFSSTFEYYVLNHSTANLPVTFAVHRSSGEQIRMMEDNWMLEQLQQRHQCQDLDFFSFETDDQVSLNGWMIKPVNFDPTKKYPLFMFLYGGPGSQQVNDRWGTRYYWWFQYLAQQGIMVACVDNRGTGGRGQEFKKVTYQQLGKYETIDQINAAKHLGNLQYVDEERIGIFGWSYGGYMSTLCLLKGFDVFSMAIAVAPVTNWKWYDTIYTERFMRTAQENPSGYFDNSPVNFAHQLRGDYLLIHGLGDDNVHFQHTAEMANALISANKQFDTYFYPNRAHGISGNNARLHLFQKMTDFVLEKL